MRFRVDAPKWNRRKIRDSGLMLPNGIVGSYETPGWCSRTESYIFKTEYWFLQQLIFWSSSKMKVCLGTPSISSLDLCFSLQCQIDAWHACMNVYGCLKNALSSYSSLKWSSFIFFQYSWIFWANTNSMPYWCSCRWFSKTKYDVMHHACQCRCIFL